MFFAHNRRKKVLYLHVVFLTGTYHPHGSAVSNCVRNVALELTRNHKVTIVCEKSMISQETVEIIDGQYIKRFMTNEAILRGMLESRRVGGAAGYVGELNKIIYNAHRLLIAVKLILSRVTVRRDLVCAFQAELNMIEDRIDMIVPASLPFESVIAAARYKSETASNALIVPLLFDQFADNDLLHRLPANKTLKRSKHIDVERNALVQTDMILAMHTLKSHFSKEHSALRHIQYVEHPLITKISSSPRVDDEGMKIAYVGSLNKNYVTPGYLLRLFEACNIDGARMHFYIRGNCSDIVNKFCGRLTTKMVNHGSVDKQTANQVMCESHVLINIAEQSGRQVSSKIFEYMACGKPIIHFYSVDSDVNLKILARYPLALCLKQDEAIFQRNVVYFEEFCNKHYNMFVPFEEVEKIFWDAVPKYTADLMEKLLSCNKVSASE